MHILIGSMAALVLNADESFFPHKEVQGWTVYGRADSCWMTKEYEDGSVLKLSRDSKATTYIVVRNTKWASIRDGARYTIDVTVGSFQASESGGGARDSLLPPGFAFFFDEPASAYQAVRSSPTIYFSRDGKTIGHFSLSGSAAAASVLEQCMSQLRAGDPFAE